MCLAHLFNVQLTRFQWSNGPIFHFHYSNHYWVWFTFQLSFNRVFFPTCQVRVVRFYQSCSPPPPPPPLPPPPPYPPPPRSPDPSGHSRTSTASSTASSRSQWALPDLNRELQIAVGTAGPQPRLPGRSGHCRTSTATSRSQWALPDLNGKNVRKDVR